MNPLIFRKGVCDPHIHIFQGKAYLYATHDSPGWEDDFHMEDWQIWSSENLIDWSLESVIHPEDFYCGALNQCWAVDAACKDGTYYLYYSTGDWGVGVGISENPEGPFTDPLGEALADYRSHPAGVPKWDPCVFQDDDGEAYLIAGTCKYEKPWDCYLIARLADDMIHLAEPLRRLEYVNNPWPEDKPSLHKYNGRYYLTHSSYYAVAERVYGPYYYQGNTGCNIDHGSFFTYHNQTYFASGGMDNPNRYLRASFLAPCHYRENGEIVIDQKMMEYGCGQYDAAWKQIYASWYFAAARECKQEDETGAIQVELLSGEYLYFPEITNIEENTRIQFYASAMKDMDITVREDALDGPVLGSCKIGQNKAVYATRLHCSPGKKSLYIVADGALKIQWFSFLNEHKRYTLEPVFSVVGRGASIAFDPDAGNHQVLQNMELRGAAMEALADGGKGGKGTLSVPYFCTGADTALSVYVNHEYQGILQFPVTPFPFLGKVPCISKINVQLKPGINRVRLSSDEYQEGRLAIDHITVESELTSCQVYAAANGVLKPRGNGCWDGFPQRESDPGAFSGRIVKYLGKPGDEVCIQGVDGGQGGAYYLEIHYCRGEEGISCYDLLINAKKWKSIRMQCTGRFSTNAMETYCIWIKLKKGDNTLSVIKTGEQDKGIFIDAFSVIPAESEK